MPGSIFSYGEMLVDILPDVKLPGGAPMNVAIHLRNLGCKAELISKVGNDPLGDKLTDYISKRGLDLSFIQRSEKLLTGSVNVTFDKKHRPSFEVAQHSAWDEIEVESINKVAKADYFIHGSLACRSAKSKNTLKEYIQRAKGKIVFDLNLRFPYYNQRLIEELIKSAQWIKLNEEELGILSLWYKWKYKKVSDAIMQLIIKYPHLEVIIVTSGEEGATVYSTGNIISKDGMKVKIQNTVGCGDAFLAGFIARFDETSDINKALDFGIATGALVASSKSANPKYSKKNILQMLRK